MSSENAIKITFKKVKNKFSKEFRKKIEFDESEDEDELLSSKCEEMIELRKYRCRPSGIKAELLLSSQSKKKEEVDDGPFKTKYGGMLDLHTVKNTGKLDDAYDTGIGTAFSVETNKRDEDKEMQKYIEENLAFRKGVSSEDEKLEQKCFLSLEEAALHSVPEFLRKSSGKRNEEMLSNQMLNGIPEVDLGLETKIKNIEATEDAKQTLLKESMMKQDRPSEFVPQNMAVNFVQHNRFNINEASNAKKDKKNKTQEVVEPVVGGGVKVSSQNAKRTNSEKATDDLHYERFKKQFRRH